MMQTPEERRLAELAKRKDRDAYNAHFAGCWHCKGGKCAIGFRLLLKAKDELGDGRK